MMMIGRRAFATQLIATAIAGATTGCMRHTTDVALEGEAPGGTTLDWVIDHTGSPIPQTLRSVCDRIRRDELLSVITTFECVELSIYRSDVDGLNPVELRAPLRFARPKPAHAEQCAKLCPDNMRQMVEAENEESRRSTRQAYRRQVQRKLAILDQLMLAPADDHETDRSDIAGALMRFSMRDGGYPRLGLYVTDILETIQKRLPEIPAPLGDVRVLVLLVPATAKEATRIWGRSVAPWEQFRLQSAELRRVAPWAVGVAPQSNDLARLLERVPKAKHA
jgi:hypothetical protein